MIKVLFVSLLVLVLSILISISLGTISIPLTTVISILLSKFNIESFGTSWSVGSEAIIWNIRTPRVLLASIIGAGLSIVGATLQSVTRNPLSDPHLLGISSGAAFGAILALLHTGLVLGSLTVPLFAFIGSILATVLVLSATHFTKSKGANNLILAGVAVSFVLMAFANLLIFYGDPRATHTVIFWMLGGLGLASWSQLLYPLIILIFCSIIFLTKTKEFNAMTVGDETASTLGINVSYFRIQAFIIGALITGVMVAFSGIIGFVGLMIPHITRIIVGGNFARVLPVSMIIGSIFLVWADVISRTVISPEEIPVGIITGLIGGLFFLFILRNKNLS